MYELNAFIINIFIFIFVLILKYVELSFTKNNLFIFLKLFQILSVGFAIVQFGISNNKSNIALEYFIKLKISNSCLQTNNLILIYKSKKPF